MSKHTLALPLFWFSEVAFTGSVFSTEFSSTGLFWGMRNIPDLKMYLVKTTAGVTKMFNLLIPWAPVWSSSGCRARAVSVCVL